MSIDLYLTYQGVWLDCTVSCRKTSGDYDFCAVKYFFQRTVPQQEAGIFMLFLQRYSGLLLVAAMTAVICLNVLLLSSCGQQKIPLIEQHCGTCHSAAVVYQSRRTEEGWRQIMHGMKIRGMEITPEEEEQVYAVLFRELLPE